MSNLISDTTLTEQDVRIGQHSYRNVKFIRCRLIFDGNVSVPTAFDGCHFIDCGWFFEGAAGNTINFINAITKMMGPNGKRMLKNMFNL